MAAERLSVSFRGRVQGVGFRDGTRRTAKRFDVRGFVRNQPDGSVLMIAEGERKELQGLLDAVLKLFEGNVASHTADWSAPSNQYASFEIEY